MRKKPEWVLVSGHGHVAAVSRSIYESYQEKFSAESWGIKLLAEGLTKEMAQNMARLTKETT